MLSKSSEATPEQLKQNARHSLITTVALGTIALLLFAVGCFLWGTSATPNIIMTGFNFFPSLAGSFISFIGLGVFCAATVYAVKYAYQRSELAQLPDVP